MRERICKAFRRIPGYIWNTISDSQYYGLYQTSAQNIHRGLGFSEETLTDLMLLQISKKIPYEVLTVKFGRNYEGNEGADFELLFADRSGVIGLRIQSKRLKMANNNYFYSGLDYPGHTPYQVNRLIQAAAMNNFAPLYFFYNYWDLDFQYKNFLNPLVSRVSCCRLYSKSSLGVTMASAGDVEALINQNPGRKLLEDVLPFCWPVYCLACCLFSDLTNSIYKFVTEYMMMDAEKYKIKIHKEIPKPVKARFEGIFEEDAPGYTVIVLDAENPNRDANSLRRFYQNKK